MSDAFNLAIWGFIILLALAAVANFVLQRLVGATRDFFSWFDRALSRLRRRHVEIWIPRAYDADWFANVVEEHLGFFSQVIVAISSAGFLGLTLAMAHASAVASSGNQVWFSPELLNALGTVFILISFGIVGLFCGVSFRIFPRSWRIARRWMARGVLVATISLVMLAPVILYQMTSVVDGTEVVQQEQVSAIRSAN